MNYIFGDPEKVGKDIYGWTNYFGGHYRSCHGRIGGKIIYLPGEFTTQRSGWKSGTFEPVSVYPNLFVDTVMSIAWRVDMVRLFRAVYPDIIDFKPYVNSILKFAETRSSHLGDIRCGVFLRFDKLEFAFPFDFFELKVIEGGIAIVRRDLAVIVNEMDAGLWGIGRVDSIDEKFSQLFTDVGTRLQYDD
jgi:hypothetical protein